MADPKSAALPLGDAPMVSVRPKYRVASPELNKRTGRSESARSWTPLAGLTRHRRRDGAPQLVDRLPQQGQGADHRDADQHQDQCILGMGLAGLQHVHQPHATGASAALDPPNDRFGYAWFRRPAPA